MDCNLPGSSIHTEWVSRPFSRGSSRPRARTLISYVSWAARLVLHLLSHNPDLAWSLGTHKECELLAFWKKIQARHCHLASLKYSIRFLVKEGAWF